MKTQNELNALKKEFDELNTKLRELNDDELEHVLGGGLNPENLTTVLDKVNKLLVDDVITCEQHYEICMKAFSLTEDPYKAWAYDYAISIGLEPVQILY